MLKFDGNDPEIQELLEHRFIQDGLAQGCVIRVLTAKSTRYAYVSSNSADVLGLEPADQLGRSSFDFISPDATPWVRDLLAASAEGPMRSWYQTGQDADGEPVWVYTESMPVGHFIVGRLRPEGDAAQWKRRFESCPPLA